MWGPKAMHANDAFVPRRACCYEVWGCDGPTPSVNILTMKAPTGTFWCCAQAEGQVCELQSQLRVLQADKAALQHELGAALDQVGTRPGTNQLHG